MSAEINDALVAGDLRPQGNDRRCALLAELVGPDPEIGQLSTARVEQDSNTAFQHYYDQPFCTDEPVMEKFVDP